MKATSDDSAVSQLAGSALLALLIAIAGWLALPDAAGAAPKGQRTPMPGATPIAPTGDCGMWVLREIAPRVLVAGEAITVETRFGYHCDGRSLPLTSLMLSIEASQHLHIIDAWGLPQPLFMLRRALLQLVDEVESLQVATGALTYHQQVDKVIEPSARLEHWPLLRNWLNALQPPFAERVLPHEGVIRGATQFSRRGVEPGHRALVLIVDAGAETTNSFLDVTRVCDAHASRVALAVLSLAAAEKRMRGCPTAGLFFNSESMNGADIEQQIERFVEATLRESLPHSWRVEHPLNTALWSYDPESGVPHEPVDQRPGLIVWQESLPREAREHEDALSYRIVAAADIEPGVHRLDVAPGAGVLLLHDNDRITRRLPPARVCVHRPGHRVQDCGAFEAGLTATPPVATATAQVQPTTDATLSASATAGSAATGIATGAPMETATPTGDAAGGDTPVAGTRAWLPILYQYRTRGGG